MNKKTIEFRIEKHHKIEKNGISGIEYIIKLGSNCVEAYSFQRIVTVHSDVNGEFDLAEQDLNCQEFKNQANINPVEDTLSKLNPMDVFAMICQVEVEDKDGDYTMDIKFIYQNIGGMRKTKTLKGLTTN